MLILDMKKLCDTSGPQSRALRTRQNMSQICRSFNGQDMSQMCRSFNGQDMSQMCKLFPHNDLWWNGLRIWLIFWPGSAIQIFHDSTWILYYRMSM